MEKHNKGLENIRVERDSLQATLKKKDANYWNLKAEKDILSVEHNKLQRDYKNTEQTLLKQQKDLEELKMEVGNVYQTNNDIEKQANQRHAQMNKNLQKQMAFNEKLHKLIEETRRIKPFIYDNVFIEKNEFRKQNTLLQVKFKAFSMEEKDADLWWDAVITCIKNYKNKK